jgi:Predicted transcriptional regulators
MARKEFETLTPQMFYILLALIKPMHGYDIMNEVSHMSDGEIQIGAGTLYTLLPRLEKELYIQLIQEENKRKIYRITNRGKKKLLAEKEKMIKQIQLLNERMEE